MSSNGCCAQDQASRTPMQAAAKLLENGVSPSKVVLGLMVVLMGLAVATTMFPFLLQEQEKGMQLLELLQLQLLALMVLLMLDLFPAQRYMKWLFLIVVVVVVAGCTFPFLRSEVLVVLTLGSLGLLELLPTLERVVNFWKHGHGARPVKWGTHEWVLDSGAWIHHTSKLELLLEGGDFQFQEVDNKYAPSSGDDDAAALLAQGRGSVRTDCFDFPGVHYVVGDDTRNVVSVSQLARDHGLVTVFEPTSCHVMEKKTGKIVGKGRLRNGMYMLDALRIVSQHIRDGGPSGSDRNDGADGGGGDNEEGDSTAEGRGGDGRDGRGGGGGTPARNQEESSGSGAAGRDINKINEEREGDGNDEDDIEEIGEINGKWEKEDDEKRGGKDRGQLSSRSHTGLFGMSRLDCIWCIVSILFIAARILQPYTGWGAGVTVLPVDFHSLVAGFLLLFILSFHVFKIWMSRKEEETLGPYLQELSHQEQNKLLFGLSRFDETTDPTGYHLPAGAFPATNAARREEFLLDSGASFHMTWDDMILIAYPKELKDHTKLPTRRFGGVAGSIEATKSGYLSTGDIKLDGVLLAPESRMNLVSVGQLASQYDVQVVMDEVGFAIKKKQGGVQIGGGKIINYHLYVLEYFQPGGLFAVSPTPDFKIFGQPRVNTVPCPSRSTTTEETGTDSEETGAGRDSRAVRMRRPNTLVTGPMWSS